MDLLKSSCKIRRKADTSSKFARVDSPLAKYDSEGNLSCVLCRIPIKANVWKVHLNSKQHKQCVELAKTRRTNTNGDNISKVPATKPSATKVVASVQHVPVKETLPLVAETVKQDSEKAERASVEVPSTQKTPQALPEKFFDNEKSVKSSDNDPDAEWAKFQKEIREADTISNIIVAEEQDTLNIRRHLKEIDEQIENWKRFEKINDKKNVILSRERKQKRPRDLESDSSSNEECSVDDLLDWRAKSVQK